MNHRTWTSPVQFKNQYNQATWVCIHVHVRTHMPWKCTHITHVLWWSCGWLVLYFKQLKPQFLNIYGCPWTSWFFSIQTTFTKLKKLWQNLLWHSYHYCQHIFTHEKQLTLRTYIRVIKQQSSYMTYRAQLSISKIMK